MKSRRQDLPQNIGFNFMNLHSSAPHGPYAFSRLLGLLHSFPLCYKCKAFYSKYMAILSMRNESIQQPCVTSNSPAEKCNAFHQRYFCDLLTWDFWQKRKVFIENSFCGLRRQLECAVAREVAPSWSQSQFKSNLGFLFTSRHLRRSRSDTVSPTFRGFHPSIVCLVLFVLYRCMLLRRGVLFQKVNDTFPTLQPIIWTWEAPLQKFPHLFST